MGLTEEQLDELETFFEGIGPIICRAHHGLLTVKEGLDVFRPLCEAALSCVPKGCDEWRMLDKEFKGVNGFFQGTPTGYISRADAQKFLKIAFAVGGLLKTNGRLGGTTTIETAVLEPQPPELLHASDEYVAKRKVMAIFKSAKKA